MKDPSFNFIFIN